MSYAPEVIADETNQWTTNALRFATEMEATQYVTDLGRRWTLVKQVRVVESDDPVNAAIDEHGRLVRVDHS